MIMVSAYVAPQYKVVLQETGVEEDYDGPVSIYSVVKKYEDGTTHPIVLQGTIWELEKILIKLKEALA